VNTALEIRGLGKCFGNVVALDGLDLTIGRGRVIALVGPNGAGKSTLIRAILGLVHPDTGTLALDGEPLGRDWRYRGRIGYMPQAAHFPDNLTPRVVAMLRDLRAAPAPAPMSCSVVRTVGRHGPAGRALGAPQKLNAAIAFPSGRRSSSSTSRPPGSIRWRAVGSDKIRALRAGDGALGSPHRDRGAGGRPHVFVRAGSVCGRLAEPRQTGERSVSAPWRRSERGRMRATRRILRWSCNVLRSRTVLVYAALLFLLTDALFRFGGSGARVVLSLLNVVLILVPLVSALFGTMYVYGAREFTELLLAQPVGRRSLFTGLYLGLSLPLAGAFLAGVGLPFIVHAKPEAALWGPLLMLLAADSRRRSSSRRSLRCCHLGRPSRVRVRSWLEGAITYDG
jgi:hypothetical protein